MTVGDKATGRDNYLKRGRQVEMITGTEDDGEGADNKERDDDEGSNHGQVSILLHPDPTVIRVQMINAFENISRMNSQVDVFIPPSAHSDIQSPVHHHTQRQEASYNPNIPQNPALLQFTSYIDRKEWTDDRTRSIFQHKPLSIHLQGNPHQILHIQRKPHSIPHLQGNLLRIPHLQRYLLL